MHGQWSSPAYAVVRGEAQVIFPGGDGWVYAFRPTTGQLLWKFDANPKDALYALGGRGTRSDFVTLPVVHENRLYIGLGQDPEHDSGVGHFWCIDLVKATNNGGDVSPESPVARRGEQARPNPKSAAAWHFGGMRKKPGDDERDYFFGRTMSSPAVVGGLVYIAELEGILHCLDAATGEEYWQHDMEAPTWSSAYYADGKVFLGNDKNKVLIFAHGKAKKLLAVRDMGGKVRMTPVVADDVLYVMTDSKLYAIAAKP
jgi:outer membrane protein assembly factor BamB